MGEEQKKYREILGSLERSFPGQIYLNTTEFARAAGIAKGTLYNRIHSKSKDRLNIPVVKIGNRPKFRIHDAARFLAAL